ncbi:MAG: MFS transporter [Rhodopseudomonas sp.]|uniref:MFS transporter n=1 Tax=Rhodopseudomonas sp. TaxID=1078 RepID=UPI001824BAE8|nr:MFS transporter [Rhodopseudomonas sp.]NVN84739.1 MFS transporter [Rhodopseudomonas sp.]
MPSESQIPIRSQLEARRFAIRLALFYGAIFGVVGTYLPFFTVWLKAIGIDAWWIGVIVAAPSVTRFTILPFVTALAERRQALRGALIVTAIVTVAGFAALGTLRQPFAVFVVFVVTACAWTPMVPLTDGYALKGVARYGLNYGPLRLWGSAAFVVGALVCGLLVDVIAAEKLIFVIAGAAALGAITSFGLRPLDAPARSSVAPQRTTALLRSPGFLAIIVAAALIQGSHAAYYTFASIAWQGAGFGGMTIAALWVLGVIAEIVVFALSPRFALSPALLVVIGALSAVARWLITAQDPPLAALAVVQLLHGLTYGLTQVGTMGLLIRYVPGHVVARAQGYLTACTGIAMSGAAMLCGAIYAQQGQRVYYLMAAMAIVGALVMLLGRRWLDAHPSVVDQPHNAGSGG